MNTSTHTIQPAKPSARFASWVDEQVGSRKRGAMLPSAGDLAHDWGLSLSTVTRILQRFQKAGKLTRIPGRGTFIQPDFPVQENPRGERLESWRVIAEEIRHALAGGGLKTGEALPSVKFMSMKFRVAPRTVIAAYRSLQDRRLIVKMGKTFWVGAFPEVARLPGRGTIMMFVRDRGRLSDLYNTDILGPAYTKMEKELHQYGYRIDYRGYDELPGWSGRLRAEAPPAGLVFSRVEEQFIPDLSKTVTEYHQIRNGPVVVDLWSGDYRELPGGVRVVSRGNIDTTIARAVAVLIERRKERSVVFHVDCGASSVGPVFLPIKIRTELKALDPTCSTRIIVRSDVHLDPSEYLGRLWGTVPASRAAAILGKYRPGSPREIESELLFVGPGTNPWQEQPRGVWVFNRDKQAVEALRWGRDRGCGIPRDFAIITLENSPDHYQHGLTACVGDWDGIGYLMAHAMIGDIPLQRTSKGFLRLQAAVFRRDTA